MDTFCISAALFCSSHTFARAGDGGGSVVNSLRLRTEERSKQYHVQCICI